MGLLCAHHWAHDVLLLGDAIALTADKKTWALTHDTQMVSRGAEFQVRASTSLPLSVNVINIFRLPLRVMVEFPCVFRLMLIL